MSTPCFGTILGIDLREGLTHGIMFLRVGDEVEVLTFEDDSDRVPDERDDGIRWVESIEIADGWVVVRTDASPHFAIPLADVSRVWLK